MHRVFWMPDGATQTPECETCPMPQLITTPIVRFSFPAVFIFLAACDSGSSNPADALGSSNGLAYATAGITLNDAEGATMSLATAGYAIAGGGTTKVTSGQTVRLDSGALSGALNGTIQVAGEQVTITNGAGMTSGGDTVAVTYDAGRSGTYAGALEVRVEGAGSALASENVFVFGFETDPVNIALRNSGSLTYTGGFEGNGVLGATETAYNGTITLTADFTGSGSVSGSLDGVLGGATDVDMSMPSAGISGNGFGGDLNCTMGCTNDGGAEGTINGVFYGPDAEEVGGILVFDFEVGADSFIGAGNFVLTNPTP